jgi:hypothetical protein
MSFPQGTPAFYHIAEIISLPWRLWMRAPLPREESRH